MKRLGYAVSGAVIAVAIMISCSDDSPGSADAATSCEPPLAGRIVTLEHSQTGSATIVAGVACPAGSTRLGGGCELDGQNKLLLRLNEAGRRDATVLNYTCIWDNPDMVEVTGTAWATCLVPAP